MTSRKRFIMSGLEVVPPGGIEPPTRGFSVRTASVLDYLPKGRRMSSKNGALPVTAGLFAIPAFPLFCSCEPTRGYRTPLFFTLQPAQNLHCFFGG